MNMGCARLTGSDDEDENLCHLAVQGPKVDAVRTREDTNHELVEVAQPLNLVIRVEFDAELQVAVEPDHAAAVLGVQHVVDLLAHLPGLLDGLDGRVARLTNTQSDFGEQYDSLADLISFGLAPALLAFTWSLTSLREISAFAGKLGWLAAFLFVSCAALRLARFNTQAGIADKSYFQGLASPAAAGTLISTTQRTPASRVSSPMEAFGSLIS